MGEKIKMKIAFLIDGLGCGGAERVACELLNELVKTHDCTLIVVRKIKEMNFFIDKRVKLISLDITPSSSIFRHYKWLVMMQKLIKLLRKNNFSSVVSFLLCSHWLNVASKPFAPHKAVISVHLNMSEISNIEKTTTRSKIITKFIFSKADEIFAVSKAATLDLRENFGIKKAFCIYNPMDIAKITELKNADIEIKKEGFTFVSVGRLTKVKNHKILLKAMSKIDAKLWIIGAGELENELANFIKEQKLENKVKMLGKKENPFAYMAKADALVLSSLSECLPCVLLEALACSLPIISTDCKSGPREIISPNSDINKFLKDEIEICEYGILCPSDNADLLAKAMSEMMENSALREEFKAKANKRAKDFDKELIISEYEKILKS